MAETHGGAETHEAAIEWLMEVYCGNWITGGLMNEDRAALREAAKAGADALAALSASSARVADLEAALMGLRRNFSGLPCWCDKAIGHPSMRHHSGACLAARAALGEPRP